MTKKIERNDPCPCGSGKKYKKCHLPKADNPYNRDERQTPTLKQVVQQVELSECVHPDHSQCSEEKLVPQPIREYRLFRKLLTKGHLVMPIKNPQENHLEAELRRVSQTDGRIAYGFCKAHETAVFDLIESQSFDKSPEHVFLYNYRAFAKHYKETLEAYRLQKIAFEHYLGTNSKREALEQMDPQKLAVADNQRDKALVEQALETRDFAVFDTHIFELEDEIEGFSANVLEVERDLEGRKINDIYSDDPDVHLAKLFLTVFPEEGKSYLIFSWFQRDSANYRVYIQQLTELFEKNQTQFLTYLTNLIIRQSEDVVIGARLWASWKARGIEQEFEKDWDDDSHRVVNSTLTRLYKGKELMVEKPYSLFEPLSQS